MAVTKEELIQLVKTYKVNTDAILATVTDTSEREKVYNESEKFNNALELLALCEKDKTACKDDYYQIVFNPNMKKVVGTAGMKVHVEFIVINKESSLFMRKWVYKLTYDAKTNSFYKLLTPITDTFGDPAIIINAGDRKHMFSKEWIDQSIVQFIADTIPECMYEDETMDEPNEATAVNTRQIVEDTETHKRYYMVPVDEVPPTPASIYQQPYPTVPGLDCSLSYGIGQYYEWYTNNPTPFTTHFYPGYDEKE